MITATPMIDQADIDPIENSQTDTYDDIEKILEPAKNLFNDPASTTSITFEDLCDLVKRYNKPKKALTIVLEYTDQVLEVVDLLEKLYSTVNVRKVKSRITRMEHAMMLQKLNPPQKPVSNPT